MTEEPFDLFKILRPTREVAEFREAGSFGEQLLKLLATKEKVKPLVEGGWIRASRLGRLCAREEVLAARAHTVREYEVEAGGPMNMGIGHHFHRWVQREASRLLVGLWRCRKCGLKTDAPEFGAEPPALRVGIPLRCPRCRRTRKKFPERHWRYIERMYVDEDLRVRGHPDAFWRISSDPADDEVVEFKTINQYQFEAREEPYLSYVMQVQTYLWLTGLRRGRIVLVNKGGSGHTPAKWFREYIYARDEHAIESLKTKATEIWAGVGGGELPNRICLTSGCKRAKECPMVGPCFGTEEGVVRVV